MVGQMALAFAVDALQPQAQTAVLFIFVCLFVLWMTGIRNIVSMK